MKYDGEDHGDPGHAAEKRTQQAKEGASPSEPVRQIGSNHIVTQGKGQPCQAGQERHNGKSKRRRVVIKVPRWSDPRPSAIDITREGVMERVSAMLPPGWDRTGGGPSAIQRVIEHVTGDMQRDGSERSLRRLHISLNCVVQVPEMRMISTLIAEHLGACLSRDGASVQAEFEEMSDEVMSITYHETIDWIVMTIRTDPSARRGWVIPMISGEVCEEHRQTDPLQSAREENEEKEPSPEHRGRMATLSDEIVFFSKRSPYSKMKEKREPPTLDHQKISWHLHEEMREFFWKKPSTEKILRAELWEEFKQIHPDIVAVMETPPVVAKIQEEIPCIPIQPEQEWTPSPGTNGPPSAADYEAEFLAFMAATQPEQEETPDQQIEGSVAPTIEILESSGEEKTIRTAEPVDESTMQLAIRISEMLKAEPDQLPRMDDLLFGVGKTKEGGTRPEDQQSLNGYYQEFPRGSGKSDD